MVPNERMSYPVAFACCCPQASCPACPAFGRAPGIPASAKARCCCRPVVKVWGQALPRAAGRVSCGVAMAVLEQVIHKERWLRRTREPSSRAAREFVIIGRGRLQRLERFGRESSASWLY